MPPPVNLAPTPPTLVKIDGVDETPDLSTRSTGTVVITAELNDPNTADDIRMLVRIAPSSAFSGSTDKYSGFVNSGTRASVTLNGLKQNTHYYGRLYARDRKGKFSTSYNGIDFWTNRPPEAPTVTAPADNVDITVGTSIAFTWTFNVVDPGDTQMLYQHRYRTSATATLPPGPWVVHNGTTALSYTLPAGTFPGGRSYEWQVRDSDGHLWSEWSEARSFYSLGATTPPVPLSPIGDTAVDVSAPVVFTWRFVDYEPTDVQARADLRWRLVGQGDPDWITTLGAASPGTPGASQSWSIAAGTFTAGYNYEWQVRTYDTISALQSDWSLSATFWSVTTPGQLAVSFPPVPFPVLQGSLGCGTYRVFVYDQGGQVVRGEIEPVSALMFSRKRDDISNCIIATNGFSSDCCELYANLRSWAHEIVVFRDGVRVWEGPITRITYQTDSVEIEAKDVMAYLYRRIMRQGFNDSYQIVGGVQQGLHTVVERARIITVNALAPYDPNLLPYLTALTFDDDARQSRVVEDYQMTAWEQIDDLAANAGLDYTVIGRRIMYWDTHRAIGRLPELRDGDFDSPPVVTEYGMQMSNYSAVTNGSGIWGAATPKPLEGQDPFIYFGPVEMLNSAFNEASAANDAALTTAARAALIRTLESQAERNINHRWPNPVVVRVPDNSTLSPNVGVTFDQLVPGVWLPLRSVGTCRSVAQWQKLDSVTVTESSDGERVAVVMSPAPNGGVDPDTEMEVEA